MATINLRQQVAQLKREFRDVEEKIVLQATAAAINKVAMQARTQASRSIARRYSLPTGAIRKSLTISRRANRLQLVAYLKAEGVNLPLIVFKARQTRAGVTVKVGSQRTLVKSAFIATMKSGHRGVFGRGRYGTGGFRPDRKRLPITELVGVGVPTAFKHVEIQTALRDLIESKFPDIMRHEMRFRVARG